MHSYLIQKIMVVICNPKFCFNSSVINKNSPHLPPKPHIFKDSSMGISYMS